MLVQSWAHWALLKAHSSISANHYTSAKLNHSFSLHTIIVVSVGIEGVTSITAAKVGVKGIVTVLGTSS